MVSVVVPVYNERKNLSRLLDEIEAALAGVAFEVVAIDDESTDGSGDELYRLQREHERLRVLRLVAHRGQSAAIAAGFAAARGDIVVTLDADGQNDPNEIPRLLAILEHDPLCMAAIGYRVHRADSPWKRVQSGVANRLRNWITRDHVRDTGCALKAIRRPALARVPLFDGMHRFLPTLIRREGGRVTEVPVSHRPRRSGRSKYSMRNRVVRALRDALGVRWLTRRALRYDVRESGGS